MENATREQVLQGAAAFRAKVEGAVREAAAKELQKEEERQRKMSETALPADEAARREQALKDGMTPEEYDARKAAEEQAEKELSPEEKAAKLVKTLEGNISLIEPCRLLLDACDPDRREDAVLLEQAEASLQAAGRMPIQPLSSLLDMLVRREAIEETLTLNGEPYPGSLEDAFNDESIAEDDEVLIWERATDIGHTVAEHFAPDNRVLDIFEERPELSCALLRTLELCDCDGGLKTKELEALLDAEGLLYRDPRTNIPSIYPSLYGNLLKDAGGIRWEHAWITTDVGRECARRLRLRQGSGAAA